MTHPAPYALGGLAICLAIGVWRYWGPDRTREDRLLTQREERENTAQYFGSRRNIGKKQETDW